MCWHKSFTVGREPEQSSFDWFKSYSDIADLLRQYIPDKTARILMLGCGNSKLSEDVRDVCLHLHFSSECSLLY